ncbi:TetR/AcrR family transcriptional regulator C-terminal domain-containing protein [Actinoallomurus sp. NPDC052274]|uniref:TetR/AcrR family transcriptional regulator C-terminal domain-containing protein n=1 Tax=Actinoallomurus sp. NPDC052274 TaxID=3155420 RepID=UPI00343033A6
MGQRRAEVLRTAIELLDEVGLDGLTMRLLAGRLGVRASALYRHYPSKQALLDAMVAHLVAPPGTPLSLDGPWDELLRGAATNARALMLAHRDGARLMTTFQQPSGEAVAVFRALVAALIDAGLPEDTAAIAVDTVMAYVNGYTIEEQARKVGTWPEDRLDHAFRQGLELIIAGIESALPPGR